MAISLVNNLSMNRSDTAVADQVWTATSATLSDFQAAAGGAWTFIKSITASTDSDVQFINGTGGTVLDSTYIAYQIWAFNVETSVDDRTISLLFSVDGGSSYVTSGYKTSGARIYSGGFNDRSYTDQAMEENAIGTAGNENAAFIFTLFDPGTATDFTKYQFKGNAITPAGLIHWFEGAGQYCVADNVDAIKIYLTGASTPLISGTFKLYGLSGS